MICDLINKLLLYIIIGLLMPLSLFAQRPNTTSYQIPKPIVYILGRDSVRFYGGIIYDKMSLIYTDGLKIEQEVSCFRILSYTVNKKNNGNTIMLAVCQGDKFTPKVKQIFRQMKDGDKIIISDIYTQSSCCLGRQLPPFEIEYRKKKVVNQ